MKLRCSIYWMLEVPVLQCLTLYMYDYSLVPSLQFHRTTCEKAWEWRLGMMRCVLRGGGTPIDSMITAATTVDQWLVIKYTHTLTHIHTHIHTHPHHTLTHKHRRALHGGRFHPIARRNTHHPGGPPRQYVESSRRDSNCRRVRFHDTRTCMDPRHDSSIERSPEGGGNWN